MNFKMYDTYLYCYFISFFTFCFADVQDSSETVFRELFINKFVLLTVRCDIIISNNINHYSEFL